MNKYKTKEVIKMLEDDGWFIARTRGSHRQFRHPTKPGTVTVNGKPNQVLEQFIFEQYMETSRVEITTRPFQSKNINKDAEKGNQSIGKLVR